MLTLIAFIVVLGPLILVHELGHFVAAKLSNVRVEEFGLGWPPRLAQLWRGSSRLTIGGALFVTPRNFPLPQNLQVGQHLDVIADPGQQGTSTLRELRVLNVETDDLTPQHASTPQGLRIRGALTSLDLGTVYSVNWIPLGGFCRMTGEEDPSDPRSLAAQPKRHRLAVLLAGPAMNLLAAFLLFSFSYVNGIPEPTTVRIVVGDVLADAPAAEAGLQTDDVILKVDGIELQDVAHLRDYDHDHAGQEVVMTLERGGAEIERVVRIGASDGLIGVTTFEVGENFVVRRWTVPEALNMGADQFWFGVKQMFSLPALIIRGQVSAQEVKPVGPVGISQMAGDAIKLSNEQGSLFIVISFAGAISLAIGLSNMLPLPALDGGRTLFVLIEALRGRRIDPVKEGVFHLIGLALLLGLMLLLTIQELINPVASPF